jgi:hypothetical protein
MEPNLQAWPELLIEYGPYAILALFVLWVIPRSSKKLQTLTTTAPKSVQMAATGAVGVSWVVVLLMVAYVLLKWSPVRVYEGTLGVMDQSEQIYPLDDNIYIKAEGVEAPGRERWQFVLVDEERNIKKDGVATFTYCWDSGSKDCTDYIVPIKDIVDGSISSGLRFTKKDPEKAYKWVDGKWRLALGPLHQHRHYASGLGWNTYAYAGHDDLNKIKKKVASPNRVMRAEGRMELRNLTDQQLVALMHMTKDPEVIRQIRLEQKRRKQRQ